MRITLLAVLVALLAGALLAGSCIHGQCEGEPNCEPGYAQTGQFNPSSTDCPSPSRICYTNEVCGTTIICECVGDKCAPCSTDADCPSGLSCQPPIPGGLGQSEIPSHCG
jgi:hypothetical protein